MSEQALSSPLPYAGAISDPFSGLSCPPGAYCEAFSSGLEPRAHWQAIVAASRGTTEEARHRHQDRVKRMRHEDGATYNPFDAPDGRGTPWALEMIPLPITAAEWNDLEYGLIQRARLQERILADVYGPQELLRSGRLPAEMIYANPRFLHACHGIRPVADRFLSFYAADCYRGEDGHFRVIREYGGNPAGLGYALENRMVLSRVFPELYHRTQIRRLAPFFHALHGNLVRRSSLRREDPGIVLLSPGPDSPIYFEQALLSRYLGYALVEGQDLTVRNGRLYLKKLAGLEPVDTIFRHVVDEHSDPFTLRHDGTAGVAGLIQVAREGNVDMVNPVGAGFLETPVLAAFLAPLCQHLLGEPLALAGHPLSWCGDAAGRTQAAAQMVKMQLLSAFEAGGYQAGECPQLLETAPYKIMAREPIRPSLVPVWSEEGMTLRPVLLRLFVCASEHGFLVLPGGLAMTAPDVDTLLQGVPERLLSKDIWVMSDEPVERFSLLSSLHSVGEFRRSSDLPSRVADHLLWLGRYLERAEGQIRLLRSLFRRLAGEEKPENIPELAFLLDLLRAVGVMPPPCEGEQEAAQEPVDGQLRRAIFCRECSGSIADVLKRVRETARNVRDRLSRDSWRVINSLEDFADSPGGDPLDLLDSTLFALSAFSGLAMEAMTRGLGWRFMDMGRRIERALHETRLVRYALPLICLASHDALEALLEVSDSIMTYRARYRTVLQLAPVLDLLLVDESNPKSLAFQLSQLAIHVEDLPRRSDRRYSSAEERMVLEMLSSIRLLDLSGLSCDSGVSENHAPLDPFLKTMETRLLAFAQQINAHYLTRVAATPHFSLRNDGGE